MFHIAGIRFVKQCHHRTKTSHVPKLYSFSICTKDCHKTYTHQTVSLYIYTEKLYSKLTLQIFEQCVYRIAWFLTASAFQSPLLKSINRNLCLLPKGFETSKVKPLVPPKFHTSKKI